MKTRLLRSRRTIYILALSLLVVLTLPAFSAFAWGGKPARYETKEVIHEGLSYPWVVGKDLRGNMYFTETFSGYTTLNKFNPRTGEVTEIFTLEAAQVRKVRFDFWGNMYYIVHCFPAFQLYKLGAGCDEPKLIRETNYPELIYEMDVDWCGNLYFSTVIVDQSWWPVASQVWKVPTCSDEAELLFSLDGGVFCIQKSPFLRDYIYFLAWHGFEVRIFQYKDGELTEKLCKSFANDGFMFYMTLSPFKGLYYLCKKTFPGVIEVGRFTPRDLYYGTGPRILVSEQYDDRRIGVWAPPWSFAEFLFTVYGLTGDVFFQYYTMSETGVPLDGRVNWVDAREGTLKEIHTTEGPDLGFVLDCWGNLYVFEVQLGSIICIHRN